MNKTDTMSHKKEPKKALLVVSFGTSYEDSREKTIGEVEKALSAAFPDYDVRRAFTSRIILKILKERDGLSIDDVETALKRLKHDGYDEIVIQPTYMISGNEYDNMLEAASRHREEFTSFKVGAPALDRDADFKEIVGLLVKETGFYDREETAVVFMGHGSEHKANAVYAKMDRYFKESGHENYVMGTVEAVPSLSSVISEVKRMNEKNPQIKKVVLLPFMVVAGDHANHDMAGDDEDSWKSSFKAAGFETSCIIKGLGEYPGIQKLFVRHAREAIEGGQAFS